QQSAQDLGVGGEVGGDVMVDAGLHLQRAAALARQLALLVPLAQLLGGLFGVLPHLLEGGRVHRVFLDDGEVVTAADALDRPHHQPRLAPGDASHARVGGALVNDLLHRLPAVIEGGDAAGTAADGVPLGDVAEGCGDLGDAGGEGGVGPPVSQLAVGNPG